MVKYLKIGQYTPTTNESEAIIGGNFTDKVISSRMRKLTKLI